MKHSKQRQRLKDLLSNLTKEVSQEKYSLNSKVLIVDGMNTFLRSFAATNKINGLGQHVGGIVGFLLSLGHAIKFINPSRVIVVFDGERGSQTRKYLYPEYKANRLGRGVVNNKQFFKKEDEDQAKVDQIISLVEYLKCLPISLISIDDLEADDIIGHLSRKFVQEDTSTSVVICSTDQDFFQLVNGRVTVYSPTKKRIFYPSTVLSETGIHPENFAIYKALVGDSSDNIPGVHGIGDKNVKVLFEDLSRSKRVSLNEIYEICETKPTKSILYDRLLEMKNIVEVFHKIVDLRSPNISDENKVLIEELISSPPQKFKPDAFLRLYNKDRLLDNIQNVTSWINLFAYLSKYN